MTRISNPRATTAVTVLPISPAGNPEDPGLEENLVTVVTDTGMDGPDVGVIEGDVVIATA